MYGKYLRVKLDCIFFINLPLFRDFYECLDEFIEKKDKIIGKAEICYFLPFLEHDTANFQKISSKRISLFNTSFNTKIQFSKNTISLDKMVTFSINPRAQLKRRKNIAIHSSAPLNQGCINLYLVFSRKRPQRVCMKSYLSLGG